jgi:hypothetical protein
MAARIGVKTLEDLKLNILYSIIHASRPPRFSSAIDLIWNTTEGDTFLFLSEEYSGLH